MFRLLIRPSIVRAVPLVVAASLCGGQTLNEPTKSDPMNCGVPACADKANMFRKAIKGVNAQTKSKEVKSAVLGIPPEYMGCPLDRNELGRSSWDLLHSIAANYPEHPTEQQMNQMRALIEAISIFYPCIHCAVDFQKSIKQSPPRVESRASLSLWMCEQHNEVSEKLGKNQFPCTLEALDERWRISRRVECRVDAHDDVNTDVTVHTTAAVSSAGSTAAGNEQLKA